MFKRNDSIVKINLGWNGFNIDGAKAMKEMLQKNQTLEELDLTSNRLNKDCLCFILEGLQNNSTLRCLKVNEDTPLMLLDIDILMKSVNFLFKNSEI